VHPARHTGDPEVDTPRTHRRERSIFDLELTDEDMARLDELDRTDGTDRALERHWR
jgi:diketogulonate reductase-like aldo/keto reductase